jgi:hypothetical protein
MSARKPKESRDHARALWAWQTGRITRMEYQLACVGMAFISGNQIWKFVEGWGWCTDSLQLGRAKLEEET